MNDPRRSKTVRFILDNSLLLLAGTIALFDLLRQTDFIVLGEQRILPDFREVQTDEVFVQWLRVSDVVLPRFKTRPARAVPSAWPRCRPTVRATISARG